MCKPIPTTSNEFQKNIRQQYFIIYINKQIILNTLHLGEEKK